MPSLLVLASAACVVAPPRPIASAEGSPVESPERSPARTPASSPAGSPPRASAGLAARNGLLVAVGGPLQIVDAAGTLRPFDDRPDPVLDVSAGGGTVIGVDPGFLGWLGTDDGSDRVTWRRFALPTDGRAERPLLAMSPDGQSIAFATGPLQGRAFELVLVDIASGAARSIPVDRGLNGPPAWLGLTSIAVNVIGPDQHAGFVVVDTTTGVVDDLSTPGFAIAASADGSTVATDDSASGATLVGSRADLDAGNPDGMTRIPSPPGFAADRLALSGDGTGLAIVRRSDQATSLDVLTHADGAWRGGPQITLGADAVLSIAWLR